MPLHANTPLVRSHALSQSSGRSIWLKLDALQPSGSFKLRGVGFACETYYSSGARRFVTTAAGNASLAVAYAGRALSVPVTAVVPERTADRAKDRLRLEGAEVVVHGATWQDAKQFALEMSGPTDAFIHPFDDPLLWTGHATIIDEVVQSGLEPDAVVLSVGGGGLLCGVAEGLRRNRREHVKLIAVETEGAASFRASAASGRLISLERVTSIATSLGARQICAQALQWAAERPILSALVSDQSALASCKRFLDDHRILVEPACGASLALAYERAPELLEFRTVLIIACGGATASIDQIRGWARRDV